MKKISAGVLSIVLVVFLSACGVKSETHTFEGDIDQMKTVVLATSKNDTLEKEEITYTLDYKDALISSEEEAEKLVNIQNDEFNELLSGAEDAVQVEINQNAEAEQIIMKLVVDYSTTENIEKLIDVGILEKGSDENGKISYSDAKKGYEEEGLKEVK